MTPFQQNELLDKMAAVLIAEYNYYGALHRAGGMTVVQYDEYDDSHDASRRAIKNAYV